MIERRWRAYGKQEVFEGSETMMRRSEWLTVLSSDGREKVD